MGYSFFQCHDIRPRLEQVRHLHRPHWRPPQLCLQPAKSGEMYPVPSLKGFEVVSNWCLKAREGINQKRAQKSFQTHKPKGVQKGFPIR